MDNTERINKLSALIENALPPIIGNKCIYLDVPYYANIGDVLIWEGTESFLGKHHINVMLRGAWDTYDFRPIPSDVTIVLQGGGNFGDIWAPPQEFRLKIIQSYPKNRIIVLPQTIYYESYKNLEKDFLIINRHPDVTICARDCHSASVLKTCFKGDTLCLPDMAFCIPANQLNEMRIPVVKNLILFLKRTDKELGKIPSFDNNDNIDIRDWPTYDNEKDFLKPYRKLLRYQRRFADWGMPRLADYFFQYYMRPRIVRNGVRFLSQYEKIYSTRLHAAILSVLLDKTCVLYDNSYGKNRDFYESWLKDFNNLTFAYE